MKRNSAARGSPRSPGPGERSRRRRKSRDTRQPRLAENVDRTEAQRLADDGWVEWGGELIWAVAFTSGGAPIGLRVDEFDPSDLQAMGLEIARVDNAGLAGAEPDAWLPDDDVE